MKLLANANKVYIRGMEVLLTHKVHKQEPQGLAKRFTNATIVVFLLLY